MGQNLRDIQVPPPSHELSSQVEEPLTEVDTITAAGTATEVRDNPSWPARDQINDLNQILRNDVTPAGGSTTTYRYTYNADGTLATKTDGTTTWTYNWDPVGTQRPLSVEVDGVTQVAYTYDSLGRMLTRTPYSGGVAGSATSFEWDGMTVVRETTPDGVYRYYAPQGELITFDYTPNGGATASYSAHADAIGSVRAITDSTGALVAHLEYDAWGNLLPTSDFGPLPDWGYLFVGSLGVRWDAATGLYYMRQRWYDPGLQRFVSRDPANRTAGFLAEPNPAESPGRAPLKWLAERREAASATIHCSRGGCGRSVEPGAAGLREETSNLYQYANSSPLGFVDPGGARLVWSPVDVQYWAGLKAIEDYSLPARIIYCQTVLHAICYGICLSNQNHLCGGDFAVCVASCEAARLACIYGNVYPTYVLVP